MVLLNKSVVELTIPSNLGAVGGGLAGAPGSKYRTTEGQTLLFEKNEKFDGTSRLVIAYHGHGADSSQFNTNLGPGKGGRALAATGRYIVLSINGGLTANEWSSFSAMLAILDAVAWARAIGVKVGKYAGLGWSMGGLTMANHFLAALDFIGAWLWVPALDLDWFNSTPGYVSPDGVALPNNATWTAEISSTASPYGAHRPTYTVQPATIPASGTPIGQGVTLTLDNAERFHDGRFGNRGKAYVFGGASYTWGSRDATHLYDCISTGAAINLVQQLTWTVYGEVQDLNPRLNTARFRTRGDAGAKLCLALTSNDPTVPPAQAQSFLAAVNHSNIFMHPKGQTLGGHTMMFGYYSDKEIVDFYDSLDWEDAA